MSFSIALKKGLPAKSKLSIFLSVKPETKGTKSKNIQAPKLLTTHKIAGFDKTVAKLKFTGEANDKIMLAGSDKDFYDRCLILGFDAKADKPQQINKFAAKIIQIVQEAKEQEFDLIFDAIPANFSKENFIENFTIGAFKGSYNFERKSADAKKMFKPVTKCTIYLDKNDTNLNKILKSAVSIAKGSDLTRDLVNMSAAEANPKKFADVARELGKPEAKGKPATLKVTIFDKKKIQAEKMGGLLGVSQGSDAPPYFIIMEYIHKKTAPTICLVGKGITFDSGGLNVKDFMGMASMKTDMGGAGTVFGIMKAVKEIKPAVNVIGIIPATENLSGGSAYKPGDILTLYNGKTVEVLNTDAEGRLILADGIAYASKNYKPKCIMDFATLTGACVMALGNAAAGVMTDNDKYWEQIQDASELTSDKVWRLPIWEEYGEAMRSKIADLKNIGARWGGASSAGWFLKQFTTEPEKYIHVDIAGVATGAAQGFGAGLASGYGVHMAIKFLENFK